MRIIPNWRHVKALGRTWPLADGLWLAFSASGAEFTFTGSNCRVTIAGDSRAQDDKAVNDHVRIAMYLDGQRVVDTLLNAPEQTFTLEAEAGEHTVRIVKLSEAAMSTCVIKAIEGEDIRPTAKKKRLVEVIGDSITCGYGVDDEDPEHHFATATEDATRAYACKTAEALDVDYSLVSLSGYGIISGYTATAEEPVTSQLLSSYYEKLGFSYGAYEGLAPQEIAWDFTARQPDVVVINLGTNDDSYCRDDLARQQHYRDEYVRFLHTVRRCNPGAKIFCTLGMMGDRLYSFVEQAAAVYTAATGDANIVCLPFAPQLEADGIAADYHPTEATHRKAAEKLTAAIRCEMGW